MSEGGDTGRILVVGDVMTDVIVIPEGPIVRGSDRRAAIRSRPGGSAANQAVWHGAMAAPVLLAARVGAADRDMYRNYFRGRGVATHLVGDRDAPTGVLVTIVDPDGERSFLTDRGANLRLGRDDLPETLLDTTRMLVVSGYSYFADGPREAVMALAAAARRRGLPVVVDPASAGFLREVGPEAFLGWTGGASLVLVNRDEALTLTGTAEPEAQVRALGRHFDRVVLKRGPLGALMGDAGGVGLSVASPAVEVIDTTGAGDAFAAGFLSARIEGAGDEDCLIRAVEAGSRAVTRLGGQPAEQD
jgi:sugar/nucleoside kinase (ribokinase family)